MQRRNTSTKPPRRGVDPPAYDSLTLPGGKVKPSSPPQQQPKNKILRQLNDFVATNEAPQAVVNFVKGPFSNFLNARTGVQGCRLSGIIRVCYASLYLYTIVLMTIQAPNLFGPRKGLIPHFITGESLDDWDYSIYEYFPQSSLVVYGMFFMGLCSGVLLLLGIYPRLGAVGAYCLLYNLQHHNRTMWDHEFHMNRTWAFFLMLMPLDHITVRDGFGGLVPYVRQRLNLPPSDYLRQQRASLHNLSTSWPMWPFRLWQIYTCMVYAAAAMGKYNSWPWKTGTALSWIWYDEGMGRFYPNFVIDMLYNRVLPIKLQTYLSLVIEMLCFITIWPLKTRKITFIAIVILHIGIELALIMHIFEYLSVLGWVCFFVYPNDGKSEKDTHLERKLKERESRTAAATPGRKRKKLAETVVAASLLYLLVYNTFPRGEMEEAIPLSYLASAVVAPPEFVAEKLDILLDVSGLMTRPYILFKGLPPHEQSRISAVIRFDDGRVPILYQEKEWADCNLVEKEINYWYDTYVYYLLDSAASSDHNPYYALFAVKLAELYSGGKINREYDQLEVAADNGIESVSIVVHKRRGIEMPIPEDLSGFASIPRDWTYQSTCRFVFIPDRTRMHGEEKKPVKLSTLWEYETDDLAEEYMNGCTTFNGADHALHRQVRYGEPTEEEDQEESGDEEEAEGENVRHEPPTNEDEDGEDSNEEREHGGEYRGEVEESGNDESGREDEDESENEDQDPNEPDNEESEGQDAKESGNDEESDNGESEDGENEAPRNEGDDGDDHQDRRVLRARR